ncbi:MAG: TetR/AcrR family transcriptional regulator [Gammaproteobacteria bacterium]
MKTRSMTDDPVGGEEAILVAAQALFAKLGFDGVSMSAVAGAAGVSKANIYHHFASKHGLYVAVLRRSAARTSTLMDTLADRAATVEDILSRFARSHLATMLENRDAYRLLLREAMEDGPERQHTLATAAVGENFSRLTELVATGQRAGVLRAEHEPALCAALLVAANVFYFQARGVLAALGGSGIVDEPEDYADGVMRILMNGMRAPAANGEPDPA